MSSSDETDDQLYEKIDNNNWSFYDKLVYGGLGYGNICLPAHLFDIIFTVIFPPLGLILSRLDFSNTFPYIHWNTLTKVINDIGIIMKCFFLTMFFYVPGLIYALNSLKC
jgi:uncharacterized membrane protein YqaE (UPF0057 family)